MHNHYLGFIFQIQSCIHIETHRWLMTKHATALTTKSESWNVRLSFLTNENGVAVFCCKVISFSPKFLPIFAAEPFIIEPFGVFLSTLSAHRQRTVLIENNVKFKKIAAPHFSVFDHEQRN